MTNASVRRELAPTIGRTPLSTRTIPHNADPHRSLPWTTHKVRFLDPQPGFPPIRRGLISWRGTPVPGPIGPHGPRWSSRRHYPPRWTGRRTTKCPPVPQGCYRWRRRARSRVQERIPNWGIRRVFRSRIDPE